MDKDELAELQHLHNSWVNHRYTQTFENNLKQQRAQAFEGLKAACKNTTDPKVMFAFSAWWHLSSCLEEIKRGPQNDEQG